MKKKLFTTLLSAALTAVLLTGCGSKQEDTPKIDDQKAEEQLSENTEQKEAPAKEGETYVIKLGMTQGDVPREESVEVTWTERFKEEVEANSNGRITVEIYPSGQLGSVEENLSGLLNGLPEDLKQVVIDAANKVTPEASAVCARLNEEGVAKLEEYGMTVYTPTDEELEDWHEAMRQPCIDFVTEQVGSELVEELLAAIEGA